MALVKTIILAILGISSAVFVTFFGRLPVFRHTPAGFLYRLIWIYIPNALAGVDQYVTHGRLGSTLARTGHYLMYEKHPLVLIFFLALLLISELLFIPPSLTLLPITFSRSRLVLLLHYTLIPFVTTPPYIFLYLACVTRSTITPQNHHLAMHTYPYDHTIFHGGTTSTPPHKPQNDYNDNDRNDQPIPVSSTTQPSCRTCHLTKPARSKHCSICRVCIQKADHHCAWINNCVGRNNYIYFLSLMLSVALLLAYGAYLGHAILDTQLQLQPHFHSQKPYRPFAPSLASPSRPAPNPNYFPPSAAAATTTTTTTKQRWSTNLPWNSYISQISTAITLHPLIAGPSLLALLSFPLAAGLTIYHVYLVWAGMTTNESGKWADLRDDIADGVVWRARIDDLKGDFVALGEEEGGERLEQGLGQGPGKRNVDVTEHGQGERRRENETRRKRSTARQRPEWPIEPIWLVITMEEPNQKPRIRRRRQWRPQLQPQRSKLTNTATTPDQKNNAEHEEENTQPQIDEQQHGPTITTMRMHMHIPDDTLGFQHQDCTAVEADILNQEEEEELWTQWEEDQRWTQVRSLSEIENIYDLGFWDNFRDVIFNRE